MSLAFVGLIFDISRGKMKNYNRFYESNYTNPAKFALFILTA